MRAENIKDKLEYVGQKHQELLNNIFESQLNGKELEYISHLVGDILSNTTECFDYCAKDIFETFILLELTEEESEDYRKGKTRIHFPFYENDLRGNPFLLLSQYKKDLYDYLLNHCHEADESDYLYARGIRKLVNEKKHNNVIAIAKNGRPETIVRGNSFQAIVPPTPLKVVGGEGVKKMVRTPAYQLKDTGEEVENLCSHALSAARRILQEIYDKFFDINL